MGELHPLLESGAEHGSGWWGDTGVYEWSVFRAHGGWCGRSRMPGQVPTTNTGPHASPEEAAKTLCEQCPGLRAWLEAHNLKRQTDSSVVRHTMIDNAEVKVSPKGSVSYEGAVRGISWSVYSVPSKSGTRWSATANTDAFGKTCLTVGHPTAPHAAQALCSAHPSLSALIQEEAGRTPRSSVMEDAGLLGLINDDSDDPTTDWTTIVAGKDADIDELARMVSARDGAIERAIEVLTGEQHTYGDQSADMLVDEARKAASLKVTVEKAIEGLTSRPHTFGAGSADMLETMARQTVLASTSTREAMRLRSVLRAIGDVCDAPTAVPDHKLAANALSAVMLMAHRLGVLQREVNSLRASALPSNTDDCPF